MINESKEEVEYLMGKFYEYRMLAAEAGTNGADAEYKDFSNQAMEYYERAMNQMDSDAAEMERNDKMVADYKDDDANREMNKMDADMYRESKNNNKINEVELNRWAKLAGINEDTSTNNQAVEFLNQHKEEIFNKFDVEDNYGVSKEEFLSGNFESYGPFIFHDVEGYNDSSIEFTLEPNKSRNNDTFLQIEVMIGGKKFYLTTVKNY